MRRSVGAALLALLVNLQLGVGPVEVSAASPPAAGQGSTSREPDFNGDGFADLAVGGGGERPDGNRRGVVNVLYGSRTGLSENPSQRLTAEDFGAGREPSFGYPLAPGDFDGDGFTDLAVGSHGATVKRVTGAGTVHVIYGSAAGLTQHRTQAWSQASPGIAGTPEEDDYFGAALTAANFGRGRQDDLAIGVRFENNREGAVHVIYGAPAGLTATGNQFWNQKSRGILGVSQPGELFGSSLSAGYFGRSSHADLAVGVPWDAVGGVWDAGGVNVIYGSAAGLSSVGSQRWTQASRGIQGTAEFEEEFGRSLTAGRFAGTAYEDLAIGVPGENSYTGAVNIIRGSARGLTSRNSQILTQATRGMRGAAERSDAFGTAVVGANFGRDGGARPYDDLAVGIPGEALSPRTASAGSVQVVYGSSRGLNPANNQTISQATRGIRGTAREADEFGFTLAAQNFGNDSGARFADLAVGAQGAESLNVIYSTANGLTANRDQMWTDLGWLLGGTS